jgi:predicted DNA-binding transcriptional regulator AlpA
MEDDVLIDKRYICEKTGWSSSTAERRQRDDPEFPKPIPDGGKRKWWQSIMDAYIELRFPRDSAA